MAEDLQATGPVEVDEAPQRRRVWRGPWRSVVLPLVVVGAIAGAIWWLDYRPDSDVSPYDARFGPVDYRLKTVEVFDVTFAGYNGQPIKGWFLLPRHRPEKLP